MGDFFPCHWEWGLAYTEHELYQRATFLGPKRTFLLQSEDHIRCPNYLDNKLVFNFEI